MNESTLIWACKYVIEYCACAMDAAHNHNKDTTRDHLHYAMDFLKRAFAAANIDPADEESEDASPQPN